jgi:glycosyltransferase involved in cell wall biosynthesis
VPAESLNSTGIVISLIVPAHNEETLIGDTLRVLKASAAAVAEPFELIVVDDASTDMTAAIALTHGASVVSTDRRQIAASRNAGARAAKGDYLIFVDADTHVPPQTMRAALDALRKGAVGGGARLRADPQTPFWLAKLAIFTVTMMRMTRWAAGCFLFVRRDVFEAVGGFDERYFATEEIVLSRALKKHGRMVIVSEAGITSGRKGRLYGPWHLLVLGWRLLRGGRAALQRREGLELWYDGRR